MKENILLIYILLSTTFNVFSQDTAYTHKIIRDLSSSVFYGRGYVKFGEKKAADYIKKELKSIGAQSLTKDYFQPFNLNINTFPTKMEVIIAGKKLVPGKEYLISPNSKGIKGIFDIVWLKKEELENPQLLSKKKNSNKFIAIDTSGFNNKSIKNNYEAIVYGNVLKSAGIIEVFSSRPMFGVSTEVLDYTIFQIQKEAIPIDANQIQINVYNQYTSNYKTQNILGILPGETDTFIVFTAHYDHLGVMGKTTYFPGANDNASGVSMLLNLAKYYSTNKLKNHYSFAFLFFSAEEAGLLGSSFYVSNPLFPLSKIKFLINLDVIGSGEKGIQVVNAPEFPEFYNEILKINNEKKYFSSVIRRSAVPNSDQYYFYKNGVKCFFIFTLGNYKEYHNIFDKSTAVPLTKYSELYHLLIDFTSTIH